MSIVNNAVRRKRTFFYWIERVLLALLGGLVLVTGLLMFLTIIGIPLGVVLVGWGGLLIQYASCYLEIPCAKCIRSQLVKYKADFFNCTHFKTNNIIEWRTVKLRHMRRARKEHRQEIIARMKEEAV